MIEYEKINTQDCFHSYYEANYAFKDILKVCLNGFPARLDEYLAQY